MGNVDVSAAPKPHIYSWQLEYTLHFSMLVFTLLMVFEGGVESFLYAVWSSSSINTLASVVS